MVWDVQEDEQVMSMRATIVALNASLESYQVLLALPLPSEAEISLQVSTNFT